MKPVYSVLFLLGNCSLYLDIKATSFENKKNLRRETKKKPRNRMEKWERYATGKMADGCARRGGCPSDYVAVAIAVICFFVYVSSFFLSWFSSRFSVFSVCSIEDLAFFRLLGLLADSFLYFWVVLDEKFSIFFYIEFWCLIVLNVGSMSCKCLI